ncbi:MAG: SDR family NAD(P)-dependent oxidoreductase [Desulfobacteraceae bacterium]|nr:MAG: SDR family NAD(P)-dependent oxidoreductase [Desulfobacteraceae bacterium]
MKKAIVIGASSGIGRELSKILSENQYTVGVMARRVELLDELRNAIGPDLLVERIDVSNAASAMEALSKFMEKMNGVDLVVISAGTGYINPDLDWALENETIQTNVTGFAAMANVAIKHFIEKGSGHLVGISSIAALRGGRESPAYNASKAFESNYLEGLRQKIRKLKLPITITDIKPGFVKTAMAKGDGIFWAADADKAAKQIFNAIKRKKSHAYITRRWRLVAWLLKLLPGCIYERL